ncbi:SHOCT domain-containing protein [Jeotgalibacillus sp. R-1-5s-1]|uniref:SHOCT domain-containing protein n=1 Tax=Jeotgalibacillus sp. R-1-5s-1 TaxID=2555897 RepID=UPI00141B4E7A|nr:SHOCT domain-containing protein [Jeotgalibacillus sp. R-1-5s-1]
MNRYRVKPSKGISLLAMVMGIAFVVIGVTVIMPTAGAFGAIWTAGAAGITIFHAVNVFSAKGASTYEADVELGQTEQPGGNYEDKIRQLHRLKKDDLITDEEYEAKKNELLSEKW